MPGFIERITLLCPSTLMLITFSIRAISSGCLMPRNTCRIFIAIVGAADFPAPINAESREAAILARISPRPGYLNKIWSFLKEEITVSS